MAFDPAAPYPPLTALATAYRTGAASPVEVTEAHLARIRRLDPEIGAFQAVYEDMALEAAEAAEAAFRAGEGRGPFQGIPFALKDLIDIEGRITTAGSLLFEDRISPVTATVARRLIEAGGVLLGKTKTVEMAFGGWGDNKTMGTPLNPWDQETPRAPGGSSSGSGAAVAAGLAVCAVGTDTAGSVRLPAAFCGVTGLKVTAGRLPTDGIVALSHSYDTPGPLARSAADALIMLEAMDGRNGALTERDLSRGEGLFADLGKGVAGLRLGALGDAWREACASDALAAYDAALETLRRLGAEIAPSPPPADYERMMKDFLDVMAVEAYAHHGPLFDAPDRPVNEAVRARMLAGRDFLGMDYVRKILRLDAAKAAYREATRGFDAILTPTTPFAAPPLDRIDLMLSPGFFTRFVNCLGMCALATPMGLSAEGLPLSLQIAARGGEEAMALRIGGAFETARGPAPRPPLD